MKQIVHFDNSKGVTFHGGRAFCYPIDHPDTQRVSNSALVMTSEVVRRNDDGSFETRNSLYIPRN